MVGWIRATFCFARRRWRTVAQHATDRVKDPSRNRQSRDPQSASRKRTFWRLPRNPGTRAAPGRREAVVAAPSSTAAARSGRALPPTRMRASSGSPQIISKVEAMLVELLAAASPPDSPGVEQEQAAVRPPRPVRAVLCRALASCRQPDLLEGRDAEVTLLFAIFAASPRQPAQLGPARAVSWINHVMGELSECVPPYQGIGGYIGDELMAMWEHLACRPIMRNSAGPRWRCSNRCRDSTNIGSRFWMNHGLGYRHQYRQHVGNTGPCKFNTARWGMVNLASRVRGPTNPQDEPVDHRGHACLPRR